MTFSMAARTNFRANSTATTTSSTTRLVADNLTGLFAGLQALAKQGLAVKYDRVHKVLGEGNFVLIVSEGSFGDHPTSYYDLYRIQNGKIVEHWDTSEPIPPPAEWKNSNGKF